MLRLILLLLLIALVSRMALANVLEPEQEHDGGAGEESHVLVLNASNFTQVVQQHPFIVVKFYDPWCDLCQRLAPLYEQAAAILKADAHDPPIVLAKMDLNDAANTALALEHGTNDIPALKIIQNGSAIGRDYKGPISDAAGIASYIKRQAGPASAEITSAEEAERLIAASEFLVVGVFPHGLDGTDRFSNERTSFISIASELHADYEFKHTLDASFLPERPNAPSLDPTRPTIRIFKKFDEGFHDLHEFGVDTVKKFLDEVSIPHVVWMNKDPVQQHYRFRILQYGEKIDAFALLLLDTNTTNANQEVKVVYWELAKQHKGKGLIFLVAYAKDVEEHLEYLGAPHDKLPSMIIYNSDGKKYALEKVRAADMGAWLKDYLDGKVPEFLKSEAGPETNEGPVKIVVADTLDTLVLNSGKNVLLELCVPSCGPCTRMDPILEEVAIELQSNPNVVIAKIDVTANIIKDKRFASKWYPAFYLVQAAGGEVIAFDGEDKTKESIISFINKNINADDKDDVAVAIEQLDREMMI